MSVVRRLAWVSAAIAVLLVLAAGLLYALFDADAAKRQLIEQVATRTGRQLHMEGEIGLSLWPDVALSLGPLSLSEPDGKTEFLALRSARLGVAVLPLWSGQIEARRIDVDGLSINLLKRRDGRLNIDDLAGEKDQKSLGQAEPSSVPSALPAIAVAGVALRDARLRWHDEASGKTMEIADLALSTGPWSARPAEKRWAIEQLRLASVVRGDGQTLTLQISAPALGMQEGKLTGQSLELSTLLEAAGRRVDARLALQGLRGTLAQPAAERLSLDVDASLGDMQAKATLASPVAFDRPSQRLALEQLAGKLELVSTQLPMKRLELPIDGQLAADLAQHKADLALRTRLDDSRLDLKAAVARFSPLALNFTMTIDQLNVDRYLPPSGAGQAAGQGAQRAALSEGGAVANSGRIKLSPLKGLDIAGTVQVGQLQWHGLKLSALDLGLDLAGGRLQVAPLRGQLYGGSVDGRLAVDAHTAQFSMRQHLRGVALGPLLRDLANKDVLDGRGSVTLDVTTRGDTVAVLKRQLAGQAALDLRDGAVKGFNLAKLLRDAKAALTGQRALSGMGSNAEKTDFSELTASFKIVGGVAHNQDLLLKAPFLRLSGEGDVDLAESRLDYLARVSVVNTSSGQEGRDLAHLNGVTIPLRLRGPFDQLSYSLELDEVLKSAAKARLEAHKEALKAKAVEQLGDKLKGLFGR